jgi:selT/selW/selH-like putative selenoprotein
LDSELIRSSGGVFEVAMDGRILHSKRKTGEFPEERDIVNWVKAGMK